MSCLRTFLQVREVQRRRNGKTNNEREEREKGQSEKIEQIG